MISRQVNRMLIATSRAVRSSSTSRYRATVYTSLRYKTYLVGVDGSDYGYAALRSVSRIANKGDKIVSMYIPTSIAVIMEKSTSATLYLSDNQLDVMRSDLLEAQQKNNQAIENKCKEIVKDLAPPHINTYCKICDEAFSPRDELIKACYETHADVLAVGSKGLSHSVTEKITDVMKKVGGLADFAVHHAPCDVLVVKKEHEY
mmetsp:Transcript_48197/g.77199  ORF Transcript_48197/g.77199 Transcript_48197/m.77199 type:complete len:203 (-) Transcript_48197:348-956(-)|eukprot:CAMPEP_0197021284 /NCGR_PEP_ID=MMETSP1384-20130603/2166_1 /TAXON_ID=29189 /ORGANISM="Ammonia sp." /LENGTH=202 /DNA_ID=CAMNT_0042449073 /DNA_START=131 /DNA_END=739 /DNA_ORIENTATION=+